MQSWPFYSISKKAGDVFSLTPEQETEVRTAVHENREFIDRLKEVCELPPTSMTDIIQLTEMDRSLFSVRIPNLRACDTFANLLILDAYVAFREGRPDDALDTCGHILQFAEHIRDVPTTFNQLIALAMASSVMGEFLPQITEEAEFSDEAVTSFMDVLDQSVRRQALAQAINCELLSQKEIFETVAGGYAVQQLPLTSILGLYRSPLFSFVRVTDEITCLSMSNEFVKAASKPYYETKQSLDTQVQRIRTLDWRTPMSTVIVPHLEHSIESQATHEVRLGQAKIALALNRYKREYGSYPEHLGALCPEYLPAAPIDAFSGKKMLYRKQNETYLLYSVGLDGVDSLIGIEQGLDAVLESSDDIVWGG